MKAFGASSCGSSCGCRACGDGYDAIRNLRAGMSGLGDDSGGFELGDIGIDPTAIAQGAAQVAKAPDSCKQTELEKVVIGVGLAVLSAITDYPLNILNIGVGLLLQCPKARQQMGTAVASCMSGFQGGSVDRFLGICPAPRPASVSTSGSIGNVLNYIYSRLNSNILIANSADFTGWVLGTSTNNPFYQSRVSPIPSQPTSIYYGCAAIPTGYTYAPAAISQVVQFGTPAADARRQQFGRLISELLTINFTPKAAMMLARQWVCTGYYVQALSYIGMVKAVLVSEASKIPPPQWNDVGAGGLVWAYNPYPPAQHGAGTLSWTQAVAIQAAAYEGFAANDPDAAGVYSLVAACLHGISYTSAQGAGVAAGLTPPPALQVPSVPPGHAATALGLSQQQLSYLPVLGGGAVLVAALLKK